MPNNNAVDVGWIALRQAATLVHALPGVAARVRLDGALVADVARTEPAERAQDDPEQATLSPCAFRRWVVDEWSAATASEERTAWGDHDTRLSVEVGIPVRGALLPGDVYRIPAVDRQVLVVAIAADGELVRALASELASEHGGTTEVSRLCLRLDPLTEVALAYCEVDPRDREQVEPFVVDLLTSLANRVAVEQLVAWADGQSTSSDHGGASIDDLG
jgi:hypothetical protein